MTPTRLEHALWPTVAAVFLFCALAFALGYGAVHESRARAMLSKRNCQSIEQVKAYIAQAIERGEKTLPTLAYYKQHPAELRAQLREIRRQKADFAPGQC